MLYYIIWVTSVMLWYGALAWMSYKSNDHGGMWTWLTYIWGAACPIWAIMTRVSPNILRDAVMYDVTMFLAFAVVMIVMGAASAFTLIQWIGLILCGIGIVLMML